jgi:hypothetical protein
MSNHDASATAWVPDACTLPTAERPLRLAEIAVLDALADRAAGKHGREQ